MARIERWKVTLILDIDRETSGKPENWDWHTLLDLGNEYEDVNIDSAEFIEDILDFDDHDA